MSYVIVSGDRLLQYGTDPLADAVSCPRFPKASDAFEHVLKYGRKSLPAKTDVTPERRGLNTPADGFSSRTGLPTGTMTSDEWGE
jgi:hypothetical protein